MDKKNETINKETENIKKNHTEILDLKSIVIGMENSLEEFNNRFKQEEERISKLEDGAIELLSLRGIKEKE